MKKFTTLFPSATKLHDQRETGSQHPKKEKLMTLLVIASLLFPFISQAQPLSGPKAIPGDYATLDVAIAALNADGVAAPGVTFNIGANQSLTGPVQIGSATLNASATMAAPVVINGGGFTISADFAGTLTGSNANGNNDAAIVINGTDYVTIQNCVFTEQASNTTTATAIEHAIAMYNASGTSPFDGCQNIHITGCTFSFGKAATNGAAIFSGPFVYLTTTNLTWGSYGASPGDMHRYIYVQNNTFNGSYNHIIFRGSTSGANGRALIVTDNTFTDIGGAGTTSYGTYTLYLDSLIYKNNIANTSVLQTTLSYIAFASTNSGGVQEAIGNTITLESGTTTSTTYGIYFTSVGVNRSMNNNTVKFGTFPNITSGTVYGLYGTYSGGNNNINFEMNGNICSNQTFPATTATSYVFYNNATAGTNRNIFMNGNTISNLTKDNSGTLYLIYPGTANTVEVANNTITNITRNNNSASGTATTYGIYASNTATTMSVHDNTVENIAVSGSSTSTAGILRGIYATPASTSTATYYNNIIHDLSFGAGTHTGQVNGFYFTGGAATVADVYKNKIYNLNANQASGTAYGIYHNAGTTNIFNNLIGNITTPDANAAIPLAGVYVAGGTTVNLDFNTIYLNATSTGALFGSMAVYASTTPTLTMRNNILINLSTPTGAAGYSSAYRRSTTTLTTYGADSNNNLFYAGTPGPNNLIFYDGSNADQTLADFKTRVTPRDAVSVSGNPTFLSTTGSSADFLHLDPSVPTQTESGGTPVAGITDDYDGNVRNVSTPDIGADEFTGIAIDITPPNIIYTPLATVCTTGARTLTATITDASGVPTAGAGLPVLYWSLNAPAGPFTAATATSLGGDQYEFTFGGTAMLGDNVYYYIAAQDNVAPPNVGTSPSAGSGGYMANPPAASTPPSPPASYGVQAPFTGTYTVGAAGNFATLTDAVDFYNTTPCLAGPVVFELIDASYPSETFPIVIMENPNASATNTLTIRPAAANAVTISGTSGATASALIRLNGADYVIIDGVNTGGAKLIIENTSTTAGTAVIWLSSNGAGLGATNNQIKNCELKAGITQNTSTSNTYGVVVAGSTLSSSITSVTAGNDNDNNVVSGNTITKVRYGVYFRGGATANPNTGSMITNNIIGPGAFGTEQIGKGGIIAREEDGIVITGNEVRFVGGDYDNLTTGTDRAGIAFATDATWTPSTVMVKNATVTGNNIHDVVDERTFSAVGMLLAGVDGGNPTNNLVANNFISNIKANGTGTDQAVGIAVTGGNEDLIVYNSINMTGDTDPNASAAAPSQSNYGIRLSSTTTTNPTIKNNVIVNDLTSSSTPAIKNGCIDIPVSFAWGSGGSNFNVLYVNNLNPQSYAGSTGSTGGTFFATLLDWQTATSQDANSLSQDPKFIGVTDLHIDPAGTPVESGAMPIPGVTTDYDGNTRNVTTPDIGADEGNFVLLDLTGPGISYTNIPNSICIDALSLSADITDASGVNVAGGTKPRLWYKKSTEMNVLPATNTSADDGWKYVEASNASSPFIFNVDYSLLTSAVTSGDVIEYFAVAQDLVVTPNVGTNTAIYNSAPTSVALGAGAFPVSGVKSYSI
ncbi:MAG: hypothetical protein H6577_27960, partial [Lewinellaceae bacterium]|nr:hypothetical protein [Lewinellaceae bacterium]